MHPPRALGPLVYLPRTQQSVQRIANANKVELSECNDRGPFMNHWSKKLRLDMTFKVTRSHPLYPCSMLSYPCLSISRNYKKKEMCTQYLACVNTGLVAFKFCPYNNRVR